MAHQLGARFHIPHGRANAILLPYIIEYNSGVALISRSQKEYPSCVRKYCNLARILGVSNMNEVTTIRALISYLHFLNAEMGIPAKVSEACPKLTETEYLAALDDMAAAALVDNCTATNPRTPSKEDVIEIFKKIW
jgi:alcohol dehydrogenase class IV